jgi:hypothetical protein
MNPAKADIQAVHAVLNKQPRARQLEADLKSINVLMQLTFSSQSGGPTWVYLHTGEPSSGVKEAARRCGSIAAAQRAMAAEIKQLSIPTGDRQSLVAAITAEAASWDARGATWAAKRKPDVTAAVDEISGHVRDAVAAAKPVKAYLQGDG